MRWIIHEQKCKKQHWRKKRKKRNHKKNQKPNGKSEYYITTAPQKTVGGKIVIWILVALMVLASVGSLIIALIELGK